tara:strand:+ start:8285 stop:9208 length:924 start_codon:yes stop_codon:yes gene_type:complete
MVSHLLGSAISILDGNLASSWNALKGRSGSFDTALPTVSSRATSVYSFKDVLGTGGNVVQLYNSASTPNSRDFTATELTDGTYTSWYSSGDTLVTAMYDQKTFVDLTATSSIAPKYDASENMGLNYLYNPYTESFLRTTTNDSDINSTFGGNTVGQGATLFLNLKDHTFSPSSFVEGIFGIRDGSPTSMLNDRHKALAIQVGTQNIALSVKDDSYTGFQQISSNAVDGTLSNFTGVIKRADATTTELNAYQASTEIIDADTTTISANIELEEIQLGHRQFRFQTAMLFAEALSADDVATLNTEIDAL